MSKPLDNEFIAEKERSMAELTRAYLEHFLSQPFYIALASEVAPPTGEYATIMVSSHDSPPIPTRPKTIEELKAFTPPPGYWIFGISQRFGGKFDGLFFVGNLDCDRTCTSLEEAVAFITVQLGI